MAEHVLSILVKAVGAGKAAKDLKGIDAAISGIGGRAGKGIRDTANNIKTLGLVAGGVAAAGLVASVKAAADFESQLNTINTVAGLTAPELEKVGSGIRGLAKDTGASLDDLTGAYYDLVSAGIKPGADALKVLTLANTLAIGGLATTGETVDLLTSAINTYGLNAKQAAVATDQFAEAIALGKVTAAQIAETFSVVGPMAQAMGVGIDEIAASYAQLTAKGIPAAEAMTDMRSALAGLAKPTAALTKAQKVLGVNFAKIAKDKGLTVALGMIRKYSEKTGVPLAKLLGRIEAVQYTLSTTGNNAADYAKALASVRKATGVAADQMAERQQGLNYHLSRLKALAKDAGITIGSKLLPKLTPLAEKAAAAIEALTGGGDERRTDKIAAFGDSIAGAFDKVMAVAGQIPWEAVGSGLKTASEWAGKLMDVFLGMPPEVQSTIIALAALNKLSGGAITGIAGELGKGLIKGVLGLTAGVVNVKAGVVNGGGGAPGVPGKAGKVGSVLSAVGKVFIVGAAVGAFAELASILGEQTGRNKDQAAGLTATTNAYVKVAGVDEMKASLAGIEALEKRLNNSWDGDGFAFRMNIDGVRDAVEEQKATLNAAILKAASDTRSEAAGILRSLGQVNVGTERIRGKLADDIAATQAGFASARTATTAAGAAAARGGFAAASAIKDKDLSVSLKTVIPVTNNVSVSGRDIVHQTTTFSRTGGHLVPL